MLHGPHPANADPSSLLWCREDNLFKRNYQFAQNSAKENKKSLGLDFNPGPSAPHADGTREAEPNLVGPFYNLEGLITHIQVQGAALDHSADDTDSDESARPKPPLMMLPQPRKGKQRRETGLLPQSPFLSSQFLLLVLRLNIVNVIW